MEVEAKWQLMQKLDDCLKTHADLLDPQEIVSIYDLQELAEVHCYLKTEHQFSPGEVEALLQFEDPLDVARWCKEENPHQHSFPICELLEVIEAFDNFPLEANRGSITETFAQFRSAITQNYYDYRDMIAKWTPEKVFDHSEQIAMVIKTYRDLMSQYVPVMKEMRVLLQFRNPLQIVARFQPANSIGDVMEAVYEKRDELPIYSEASIQELASMRSRLKQAKNEVASRPPSSPKHSQKGAR